MEKLPKDTIGIDISNSAITAVELKVSKKKLNIINFGRVELNPGIIDDNCIIVDPKSFKEALIELLKNGAKGPFTSRNVIIAIPEEKTFTHTLNIPREHISDEEFITQSAKDFIPIELTETIINHKILDDPLPKNETRVNFVAVQKSIIDSIINTITEVGLKVVFVDVDKNSVIRACANSFHKIESDFVVIDVNEQRTTFSINDDLGSSYALDSEIGGRQFIEYIKEKLDIKTTAEVKKLLLSFNDSEESSNTDTEEYKRVANITTELIEKLIKKINKIISITKDQDSLDIKIIYIIGIYSHMPGLTNAFKKAFPEIQVISKFDYIQLEKDTELFYTKAIGLALRSVLPTESTKEINLLPHDEKEELFNSILVPKLIKGLFATFMCFTVLFLFGGFYIAKSYIDFRSSKNEAEASFQNLKNPYLTSTVQSSYESMQLKTQISTILQNILPPSQIMHKIDSYNADGIELFSLNYKLSNSGSNNLHMRAKTTSRANTESFISKLKKDQYFSKVISPLSNLSGKDERFIDIDLVVDITKVIEDYKKKNSKNQLSKSKNPSIKPQLPGITSK